MKKLALPYLLLLFIFGVLLTLKYIPASVQAAAPATGWNQESGDAQRTGYTAEEPVEAWTYTWSFNGPDATGGTPSHFYNAPP